MAMPTDYDANPDRYRLGMAVMRRYLDPSVPSLYERVWQMLPPSAELPVLDVGCAEGALAAARPAQRPGRLIGLDASAVLLQGHPRPAILANAYALPLRDRSVSAVVAINMLYHLDAPLEAMLETRRVLAAGGAFIAATISRHDSPELAAVWRPRPSIFDAEDAPELARQVFARVEAEYWDAPLMTLPSHQAVQDYLIARLVPPDQAAQAARHVPAPLTLTKRGVLIRCG